MSNGGEKQSTEVEKLKDQLGMFIRVNEEIKQNLTREKENSRILQEHLQWTVRTYYEAIFCSTDLRPPPGSDLHKFLSSVDKRSLVEVVRRKNDELQAALKNLAEQSQLSSDFFLQTNSLERNLRKAQREHGQLKEEVREVQKKFETVRSETRMLERSWNVTKNELRKAKQGKIIAQNRARMLASKLAREKFENENLRKWARHRKIV